jgi:uncharacterized repeat protein (TIGR01451 family)
VLLPTIEVEEQAQMSAPKVRQMVFQRKLVAAAAVTMMVFATALTISATSRAAAVDTCGYDPTNAPNPVPGGPPVTFDENTVTRAIAYYPLTGRVGVFANDESGLLIGSGGTPSASAGSNIGSLASTIPANTTVTSIPVAAPGLSVPVSAGDPITLTSGGVHPSFTASAAAAAGATSISVNSKGSGGADVPAGATISDSKIVYGQAVPPTFGSGTDNQGRALAPSLYLTDITGSANANGGDYEQGGTAVNLNPFPGGSPFADALYGSWSNTVGVKPVNQNNWSLGPNADAIPGTDAFGGQTTSFNEGYGAEVAWNVQHLEAYDPATGTYLALQPGHTYRAQSLTHDTDQNKNSGAGDVGEVCTTFSIPGVPSIHITKTADAPQVNAGSPIGFTLTVSNTGSAAANGVKLSDPLPAGNSNSLTWSIASQDAGWGGSCSISGGAGNQSLTCGGANGVTVPIGNSLVVHVTSPTTQASGGVCPGGNGVVNNTGTVTSTDGGNDQSSASTCVAAPSIHIVKTADAAQVNAGDPIGFTLTVYNDGTGDATGVKINDTLPTNTGLAWSVASTGGDWSSPCSIAGGVLSCGGANGVTVPKGTTQGASTFTVHITSPTTAATGGVCPGGSGTVNNTGQVTTANAGNDQSSASTCVAAPAIHILKTADAAQVNAGDPIGFTLTVYNDGSGDAKGVKLNDTLPVRAGLSWTIDKQGGGWSGTCAISGGSLTCGGANGVTVPANTALAGSTFTVHITSPTATATGGTCPGGSGVVNNTGNVTTTNDGNDQSSASTCVASPVIQIVKTADAPQVSAGDPIGFTLTVFNTGAGDATGVKVSDPLPAKAGLSWSVDSQGGGWAGTCAINAGVLTCGGANGVTVPAGTAQIGSPFTVHVTSGTTAATGGVCPSGSGVVNNTGTVTTTNAGSGQSSASTCVAAPAIHIVKTADAAQVNVGSPIGFTLTVYNDGSGDAKGVKLNDTLPTTAGLQWSITAQGGGWAGTCAINAGVLTCGGAAGVTVPAATPQAASSFTVHIASPTTATTGGTCPGGSGTVSNTGAVTTTNDGSDQSTASTCVQNLVDLAITKTGSPASQTQSSSSQISWTMVVTNNGPGSDSGVNVVDPMPAGNTFVSVATTKGSCSGGAILTCNIGSMAAGETVTIVLVTKPSAAGKQTNTVTVAGNDPETNTSNNTASATVQTVGVITPPVVYCVAVSKVTPKQLYVGRRATLTIHVTKHGKAVKGVRVRIKGPKFHATTKRSNNKGVIKKVVKMKKAGIIVFTPLASKRCGTKRVGVTGVFTPPVTG